MSSEVETSSEIPGVILIPKVKCTVNTVKVISKSSHFHMSSEVSVTLSLSDRASTGCWNTLSATTGTWLCSSLVVLTRFSHSPFHLVCFSVSVSRLPCLEYRLRKVGCGTLCFWVQPHDSLLLRSQGCSSHLFPKTLNLSSVYRLNQRTQNAKGGYRGMAPYSVLPRDHLPKGSPWITNAV